MGCDRRDTNSDRPTLPYTRHARVSTLSSDLLARHRHPRHHRDPAGMLRLPEVQRGQVTYPESHSRVPSRSHFRAVPWSHSKRLRAGHAELTAVWPLCALTPAASHLGTVGLLRVQAQTPSRGSQPPLTTPGCAAMFPTRPGVSQGLTVSLKAGAQNGAGLQGGSSSSPAAGSSHGARHTSLITSAHVACVFFLRNICGS